MRIKDEIYNFLVKRGTEGATDEQIQTSLKIHPDSERPARVQLVKDKWVVDSGLKRSVPNSNRKARVWVAIKGRGSSIIDMKPSKCLECNDLGYIIYRIPQYNDHYTTVKTPCFLCDPDAYLKDLLNRNKDIDID